MGYNAVQTHSAAVQTRKVGNARSNIPRTTPRSQRDVHPLSSPTLALFMIATQTVTMSAADHNEPPTLQPTLSFLGEGADKPPALTHEQSANLTQHLEWDLPGLMSREHSAVLHALPGIMSRECSGLAPAPMSRDVSFGSMSREISFGTMTREHSGFGDIGHSPQVASDQVPAVVAVAVPIILPELPRSAVTAFPAPVPVAPVPESQQLSIASTASNSAEDEQPPQRRGGIGIAELLTAVTQSLEYEERKRKAEEEGKEIEDGAGNRSVSPPIKKAKVTQPASTASVNSTRGAHVRERPEMQKQARDGQKHWGEQVRKMRQQWQERDLGKHTHFLKQINMCSRLHIKSQHECLLRQLQMAAVEGIIEPKKFLEDEKESFLGWTGFEVSGDHGPEFRRRIEGLFASKPSDKTLNNTFRRAGLIPDHSWAEAWSGIGGFVYDREKRQQYGGQ